MPVSLEQHVAERHGRELASVFAAIADAAIQIEGRLRTAPLSGTLGAAGQTNVQGEQQQKLDIFANEVILAALQALPSVAAAVSEENDEPIIFPHRPGARFVVIFDPLDGSANIDVDVNVGTIVSVQEIAVGEDARTAALKPGTAQMAALYVNYGPSTILVYTAGAGVHSFTLAADIFLWNAANLHMPDSGPYYSVNEGSAAEFPSTHCQYLAGLRDGSLLGRNYSSRYVGSFIADFHRTLLKGGVFLYPPTARTPHGKLRLLYEANPLAWIAEQAGGAAITGMEEILENTTPKLTIEQEVATRRQRILEVVPSALHERTALVIGSRSEVEAFARLQAAAMRSEA